MSRVHYAHTLLKGWFTIAVFGLVGLVLALGISLVQPLKYSSTVRLRVLQDVGTTDAYTASRSEERLAEILATNIYTTTFYDAVMSAGFNIDQSYFPEEDYKRRRDWSRTVAATVSRGAGFLTITAYHPNVAQAEQIARAVGFEFTEHPDSYTSGGGIEVRLIDAPLNSRWPVKPNILANAFSGLVLGTLAGVGYLLILSERIRRRHQLVHEEFV